MKRNKIRLAQVGTPVTPKPEESGAPVIDRTALENWQKYSERVEQIAREIEGSSAEDLFLDVGRRKKILAGADPREITGNCIDGVCGIAMKAGVTFANPQVDNRYISNNKFKDNYNEGKEPDFFHVIGEKNLYPGDFIQHFKENESATDMKMIARVTRDKNGEVNGYDAITNWGHEGKPFEWRHYNLTELHEGLTKKGPTGKLKPDWRVYRPFAQDWKKSGIRDTDKQWEQTQKLVAAQQVLKDARYKAYEDQAIDPTVDWHGSQHSDGTPVVSYKDFNDYTIDTDLATKMSMNDELLSGARLGEFDLAQNIMGKLNDEEYIMKKAKDYDLSPHDVTVMLGQIFGIADQETKMGKPGNTTSGFENWWEKNFLTPSTAANWSVGPLQIRFNEIKDEKARKKLGLKSADDLQDPDKAIETMFYILRENQKTLKRWHDRGKKPFMNMQSEDDILYYAPSLNNKYRRAMIGEAEYLNRIKEDYPDKMPVDLNDLTTRDARIYKIATQLLKNKSTVPPMEKVLTPVTVQSTRQYGGRLAQNNYPGLGFGPSPVYKKIQLGQAPTSEQQFGVPNRADAVLQQQIAQQKQQQALQNQPVVGTAPMNSVGRERDRMVKNRAYANNWGMRFDPNTGAVRPAYSEQFTDWSNKAGQNLVDAAEAAMWIEGGFGAGKLGAKALSTMAEKAGVTGAVKGITGKIPDIIPNVSRFNPWRFKQNPEAYYRGIGKTGLDDALQTGVLRSPKGSGWGDQVHTTSQLDVAKAYSRNYRPIDYIPDPNGSGYIIKEGPPPKGFSDKSFIAEIPRTELTNPNSPEPWSLAGPKKTFHQFLNDKPIPIDNVKFYKEHWLKGYKEIPNAPERNLVSRGAFNKAFGAINRNLPESVLEFPMRLRTGLESNLKGVSAGIKDIVKGRPITETFPITRAQKVKQLGLQDQAVQRSEEFAKKWIYDADENIRPEFRERVGNLMDDDTPGAYIYKDIIMDPASDTATLGLGNPSNPLLADQNVLQSTRYSDIMNDPRHNAMTKKILARYRGNYWGVNTGNNSYSFANSGPYSVSPEHIKNTSIHELGHTIQKMGIQSPYANRPWIETIESYNPETKYYSPNLNTESGREFGEAMIKPSRKTSWEAAPSELHSSTMEARQKMYDMAMKRGVSENFAMKKLQNPDDLTVDALIEQGTLNRFFKPKISIETKRKIIRKLPVIAGATALGTGMMGNQQQYGGSMKQNAGDGTTDAYDFGSSVLQNYAQMQQERQQQMQEQQAQQEQEMPVEEPLPEEGMDGQQEAAPPDDDELGIPDAAYFARKQYEYSGNTELQAQIEDLQAQVASMQSEQGVYMSGAYDDYDTDDDDDDSYTGSGSSPSRSGPMSQKIADKESSGGDYQAFNSAGGGEGAVGKYQFRWSQWSPDIAKVTGVTSIPEFLNNPEAQETFYKWYETNKMAPAVQRLSRYNTKGLSQQELGKLYHFRGEQGAKDWLTGKVGDKPESYNSSIPEYIRQAGGNVPVAEYPSEKYHGLNNEQLNELLIKNNGYNKYRGLDSGRPVYLRDERGINQVLFGPDDMATLYGNVYEHR